MLVLSRRLLGYNNSRRVIRDVWQHAYVGMSLVVFVMKCCRRQEHEIILKQRYQHLGFPMASVQHCGVNLAELELTHPLKLTLNKRSFGTLPSLRLGHIFDVLGLGLGAVLGGASTISHDYHHEAFHGNFALSYTYLDRIFGTFVDPKKSEEEVGEVDDPSRSRKSRRSEEVGAARRRYVFCPPRQEVRVLSADSACRATGRLGFLLNAPPAGSGVRAVPVFGLRRLRFLAVVKTFGIVRSGAVKRFRLALYAQSLRTGMSVYTVY